MNIYHYVITDRRYWKAEMCPGCPLSVVIRYLISLCSVVSVAIIAHIVKMCGFLGSKGSVVSAADNHSDR